MAERTRHRLAMTAILALVGLAVLLGLWQLRDERRRDYVVEQENGVALSKIVSTAFANKADLRVMQLRGTVQSVGSHDSSIPMLDSTQVVKAPFAADYFVDLSRMGSDNYRFDAAGRTLLVTAPPVTVQNVNIDEARRTLVRTKGVFVTRQAGEELSQKTSAAATAQVNKEANKPANILRARERARQEIAALLRAPLAVAGVGNVDVVVRFADEGGPARERWDVSRSIKDVMLSTR